MVRQKRVKVPTIVLDIDDTIVQFLSHLCFLFNSEHNTSISEHDLTDWDFTKTKVEDQQGKVVKGTAIRKYFKKIESHGLYAAVPPIKESVMAMKLMKTLGYKIILMTARREEYAIDTKINFFVHSIPYDHIIFGAENKVTEVNKLARKHTIVCFVDDKLDYVESVNETDKVGTCYLMTKTHNKDVEDLGDIERINNLLEVVRLLPEVK